ncbi:DUF2184 domain-containing protein [Xylella fastidiosa subsp. multiplex]|uniref:DUF2184 domain-containing protein n=6 Tax=Xylella fastidiosa TaxID=2371 RepID=A0AAW6HT75_XYLFS|nr:DUF2184 domain-containing protein [Xylella fastidiosa]MCH7235119.1 DUF2184 domain-containing protein [Xylella fastidiosa subsp. multiplex]MDC6407377.1 DUF2184 domain-containing protein [Xylella fastidiosa subsp. multiplex]MDC6409097.1 DUF2184 domain-containing protein [Xylella fastidiosa subsp. multiplex]MDD0936699.1 DUF2184 domain-containing protein [Xylella fastidiosa subsp. multiplex]MSS67857.1 DUF2184 domain-containing protein [Xylella fastidiosa subsp. multiplex]
MNMIDIRRRQIADALNPMLLTDARYQTCDATQALAFLVSQLTHVESTIYARQRQGIQYRDLVPISTEAGEYATSVTYQMYDYSGRGKRHSGRGEDIPTVDVAYAQKSVPVVLGTIGYDYTTEELRQSAFLRKPLNTARADAAMDAYERHINDVALFGEDELTGLYTHPGVPVMLNTAGPWIGQSPAQVLALFNALISSAWMNTQYVEMIDTVLLPGSVMNYLVSTPRSDNSDKTILHYVLENNIAKAERGLDLTVRTGYGLETAGEGGTTRAMVYTKHPTKLVLHLPMPIRFLPPQPKGLKFDIPGEYKYSGVEFRYPKSALYADGI